MNLHETHQARKVKKSKVKSKLHAVQEKSPIIEDTENKNSKITILRCMIKEDSTLNCPTDELFLLVFLRTKDYNVERAFKLLRNYWNMRLTNTDIYADLKLGELRHVFAQQYQNISQGRDQHGNRIFYFPAGRWDPEVCSLQDVFRANLCFLQRLASEPETQKNGIVAVVDMKGLSLNQVRHLTPSYAKKICSIVQDSFPLRFKGIHVLNEPWVFNIVLSLVWPFLKEKIRNRIHCHGSLLSSLHKFIHKSTLVESYGGTLKDVDNSAWITKLTKEKHHFDFFEN